MFENIIGQSAVTSQIAAGIRSASLPHALLLSGPEFSGKGSIALETARALTCRGTDADWNCDCGSCRSHRILQFPELVLLGPRDFETEILLSARALLSDPRAPRVFLFLRAVRKLVHRFDARFWPEKRIAPLLSSVDSINDELDQIEPPNPFPDEAEVRERTVNRIVEGAVKLAGKIPRDPVPVDVVRNISTWGRTAASQGKKVVIIEEAHVLQDSARNAMLKILEEPPESMYFILTSSRPGAMIPTVLSRLRRYDLIERTEEQQRLVQQRIFAVQNPSATLHQFFRTAGIPDEIKAGEVTDLLVRLARGEDTDLDALLDGFTTLAGDLGSHASFHFLTESAMEQLHPAQVSPEAAQRIGAFATAVQRYRDRIVTRNMNPESVFRSLVLSLGSGE